jgi:hypothetical protein
MLAARPGDVITLTAVGDRERAEPVVRPGHRAELAGERAGVALDDDVELPRPTAEQEIADRAADEIDRRSRREAVEQRTGARKPADLLE